MHKIVVSSVLLLLLCGPSLADPPPAAFRIGLRASSGKAVRNYAVSVVDQQCGSVSNKSPDGEDEIRVCAVPDGAQTRLEIDWRTREDQHEVHSKSSSLVARNGSFEIDQVGVKLAVSVN